MIGYVLHERGLGEDYEFYDVSLPYIFLNKEKIDSFCHSIKMTLKLSHLIINFPKYKNENFKYLSDEEDETLISQIKKDLASLFSNEENEILKPRFVGNPSNKQDQDNHLLKINEWKKSPFFLRKSYLDKFQDVIDFYNSGGEFIWDEIFDLINTTHKNDISFHIEEYKIVE